MNARARRDEYAPDVEESPAMHATSDERQDLRERLRVELFAKRAGLLARLAELDDGVQAHNGEDPIARDGQDPELGVEVRVGDALESQFRAALDDVEAAISRLESDQFGYCIDCARPIPTDRLLVVPHTQQCVECRARSPRDRP